MHLIFPMFSKYCELTQINPEHIHGHSQNMWRIYFGLIHIFPTNFSEIFSKVHSFIQIICIIRFSHDFLKRFSLHGIDFLKKLWWYSKLDFPNQMFSCDFPEKVIFLRFFSKGISHLSQESKLIFRYFKRPDSQDFNFLSFEFPSPMNLSYKFSIIFLRKFSKSASFPQQVFFLFKCSSFLKNSLKFSWDSYFLQGFPSLFFLKSWDSHFPLYFSRFSFSNYKLQNFPEILISSRFSNSL